MALKRRYLNEGSCMNTTRVGATTWSRAVSTVLVAGLIAGTLDITTALIVYGRFGIPGIRLLQGIAAGLMGKAALQGGLATAFLGLLCHFFIATSWAVLYFVASRRVIFLVKRAVVSGAVYGVIIYVIMNQVVIPLSAIGPRPFSLSAAIVAAIILVICVGIPIALIVRRFSAFDSAVVASPDSYSPSSWRIVPRGRRISTGANGS
jgi:uncharacterized membrane protein YagU involved in acid resistance